MSNVLDKSFIHRSYPKLAYGSIYELPLNKIKDKIYFGVPGNLVAYACKVSLEKGYQGFLAFDAKTALIKHYQESLYATHFRGLRMFIETEAALRLISQYFKS